MTLSRRLAGEFLGTAFLLAVVIGSGIMGERLAGGNVAIALLGNTLATGAGLEALILTFGPISGAHFNPAVTLSDVWFVHIHWRHALLYIIAQILGGFAGVAAAHGMFQEAVFFASQHVRTGPSQWWSEFVATFGLLAVIIGCSRTRPTSTPFAVAAYITAAYWFTSSTSFANPAVTLARGVRYFCRHSAAGRARLYRSAASGRGSRCHCVQMAVCLQRRGVPLRKSEPSAGWTTERSIISVSRAAVFLMVPEIISACVLYGLSRVSHYALRIYNFPIGKHL